MSASKLSDRAEEEPRQPGGKRAPWGVIALVLLTGLALVRNGSGEYDAGPPQPARAAAPGVAHGSTPSAPAARVQPLPRSVPDRVTIPMIQVDAPVTPVGVDEDGGVAAPPPGDPNLAGWFDGAVTPGEKGTAVVVGHVDNSLGPAVFYGLGALKRGNHVEVHRQDGRTAVFEVYDVEVFTKNDFPGERVYGSTGAPELRVITCGGRYTERSGYEGNVVVFARLAEVR
ncbi:class F sortase [Streptomyces mexicanus]|uniref:class F sortase n=1 Tax=Streptomyces mexicanus TaxID=178566 RepID=UPI00364AC091